MTTDIIPPATTKQFRKAVRSVIRRERVYVCPDCGLCIDRDLNAALNISRAGTAPDQTNAFGAESGYIEQYVLLGILADCNEEGSRVALAAR